MEQAGAILTQIMAELLRSADPHEAPLLVWPVVCGPVVAKCTRACLFAGGVLHVEVPDAGWRTQLAELEGRYQGEYARILGANKVKRIQFVVKESPQ